MDRKRMAELLVGDGLLTDDQMRVAIHAHETMGKSSRFGDYLVELGLLTPRNLAHVLGRQFHLDVVSLAGLHPEAEALQAVPRALAERLTVMPLSVADGQLTVAVADPLDFGIPKALASEARLRVRIVLASSEEIRKAISTFYAGPAHEEPAVTFEPLSRDAVEASGLSVHGGSGGDALSQLVRTARQLRASQLIFSPEASGTRVQVRSRGGLRTIAVLSPERAANALGELRGRTGLGAASASSPREGRGTLVVDGAQVPVELALLPLQRGERALLSLQPTAVAPSSLEELPLTRTNLTTVEALFDAPGGGITLIAGLPGEDRRSLLVGIARHLVPLGRVVALIEDGRGPAAEDVLHVPVRLGSGSAGFHQALGAVLRQEADVVLLGDLRDPATAALAFEAAASGVKIVASTQASGPAQAMERLGALGVAGVAQAGMLKAVGLQRWAARICGACRLVVAPSRAELRALQLDAFEGQVELFQGRGCAACDGVGLVDAIHVLALCRVSEGDQRDLLHGTQPWDLYGRIHDGLIYDLAAKAIGGYITGKGAVSLSAAVKGPDVLHP